MTAQRRWPLVPMRHSRCLTHPHVLGLPSLYLGYAGPSTSETLAISIPPLPGLSTEGLLSHTHKLAAFMDEPVTT